MAPKNVVSRIRLGASTVFASLMGELLLMGSVADEQGAACGQGRYYLQDEVAFTHKVDFTVDAGKDSGYLIDCAQGADAFLQLDRKEDSLYIYVVTGQLGDYD